jgi:glutaredoxin 3
MTPEIIIYSASYCSYCVRAKELLKRKGLTYTEIMIDNDEEKRHEMITKTDRQTVPQIFINHQHIGGCDDLYALERSGQLDILLG